jgi:hypothetical protein
VSRMSDEHASTAAERAEHWEHEASRLQDVIDRANTALEALDLRRLHIAEEAALTVRGGKAVAAVRQAIYRARTILAEAASPRAKQATECEESILRGEDSGLAIFNISVSLRCIAGVLLKAAKLENPPQDPADFREAT